MAELSPITRGTDRRLASGGVKLTAVETVPVAVPAQPKWTSPAVPNSLDQLAHSISIEDSAYVVHYSYGGREFTFRLEDNWIERRPDLQTFLNNAEIYDNREQAITALTPYILQYRGGGLYVGFWNLPGLPVTVPTWFSNVSAPRIYAGIEAKDQDMRNAARAVEEEMKGLAIGMLIGKGLGLAYGAARNPNAVPTRRIAEKIGSPPAPGSQTPVSRTPARPPVTPQPKSGGSTTSGTKPPRSGATSGTSPEATRATAVAKPPARGQETSSGDPRFRRQSSPVFDAYRTAPGEVIGSTEPTRSPISNTNIGRERESLLPAVMQQRFPDTQFRYSFGSGVPDAEWIGGRDPGFDIADLKPQSRAPDYESYLHFRTQVRVWAYKGWPNRQAPNTFRAAMISYNPEGDYFIEDIGVTGNDYQTPIESLAQPAKPKKPQ